MSRLANAIGPVYTTAGAQRALGDALEQDVVERRNVGTIVAMKTADDVWVYPTWQFTDGQVTPALLPALRALHTHANWSVALWFVTPNPDLDGMSALDWLETGRPAEEVTRSAAHTAAQWAA